MRLLPLALTLLIPLFGGMVSCSNQVKAKRPVSYHFESGETAMISEGLAYAPRNAPAAVKRAIAAGNRLQSMPYKWGGGHAKLDDSGYDCSGSVSYVLREAGLLKGSMPSNGYYNYGKKGEGDWINVYIRKGHVFMTVAGLRLDTGGPGGNSSSGPRWKTQTRQVKGMVVRHPKGY